VTPSSMASQCRVDARLAELIAPPPDVVGSWNEQPGAWVGAHVARPLHLIPCRWPCHVSRGDGRIPKFRLCRDRQWTSAFQSDLEKLLKIKIADRIEIASMFLPQVLLNWGSASSGDRTWALRVDISKNRLHWCFAFYEGRLQHAFGRRWLEPASGRAYHDLLWRRSTEGFISNLSEHLFAAILPLYHELEIRRIDLVASLAAGGALWPAFGAVPKDHANWKQLGKQIRSRLKREPPSVQAEVRHRIEDHLKAGRHAVLDIRNEGSSFDSGSPRLGQRLLAGTRYDAVIELDNPRTRKILENRISKSHSSK
jgi:hypothetical protein